MLVNEFKIMYIMDFLTEIVELYGLSSTILLHYRLISLISCIKFIQGNIRANALSEDSQAFNFVINTEWDYKCRLKVPLNWLRHYTLGF